MAKKILVVEDNLETQTILGRYLEREGFEVLTSTTGEEGLKLARAQKPDLMILDVNLPGMNGFEVLRQLKGAPYLPVIMVTTRHEDTEKVVGLELGADDYLTKPFNPMELLARVRAVLRRIDAVSNARNEGDRITVGEVELDWSAQKLSIGENSLALSMTEATLLKSLMQSKGKVISREQILDRVWGEEFIAGLRVVDVHISNLKKKIAPLSGGKQYIQAVRGVGYKFEV